MSLTAIMLAPVVVLLLPAAGAVDAQVELSGDLVEDRQEAERLAPPPEPPSRNSFLANSPFSFVAQSFQAENANQVRIEQRMTIRISPRPAPVQRNMLMDLPSREIGPRFIERKIGKCLPIGGIAGVQTEGANRLLLFMRDQRIVSAELERACRARDFYSGFYLSRSQDGQLCVDRDTLLSRSGANCRLTRIRLLVESGN